MAAVLAFFTSKLGAYCVIALAFAGFLFVVHHDGAHRQKVKDDVEIEKLEADIASRDAAYKQGQVEQRAAADKLSAEQAAVIQDLTGRVIAFETRPPEVVVKWKEKVIHDNAATIAAACTLIPNAFVWVRDLTYHPEYADLSATATPAMRAADAGISSPDLAKLDGDALANCNRLEFNLHQWDDWYNRSKASSDAFNARIDAANKAITEKLQ